jgi:hypothetical protein
MGQVSHLASRAAVGVRLAAFVPAEKHLGEPKCNALFTYAGWTGQQDRLWKPAGGNGAFQPVH